MEIMNAIIGVIGLAVVGIIGWAFQMGSRVSVVEADQKSLATLINTRFEDVNHRFDRLEALIDKRK